MKRPTLILVLIFFSFLLTSQSSYIPLTELTTLEGIRVNTNDIFDDSDITILVFFKTCNQKCRQQLDAMQDIWQDSLADRGVQMIAICVDGIGDWSHVKPLVNGNCWEFETYIDLNCDFKRAMNVTHIPCTIMLDASQNLLCRYNGFCSGIDKMLCEKVNQHQLAELD